MFIDHQNYVEAPTSTTYIEVNFLYKCKTNDFDIGCITSSQNLKSRIENTELKQWFIKRKGNIINRLH